MECYFRFAAVPYKQASSFKYCEEISDFTSGNVFLFSYIHFFNNAQLLQKLKLLFFTQLQQKYFYIGAFLLIFHKINKCTHKKAAGGVLQKPL